MSAIPDSIDRLLSILSTALPIEVYDGPPIVDFEQDGLSVGYMFDELSVRGRESDATLNTRGESFDVNCFLWARTGDEVVKPVRDKVFGYLDTIKTTVGNDSRLGGAVTRAQVRVIDFDQHQNSEGASAIVVFAVNCVVA